MIQTLSEVNKVAPFANLCLTKVLISYLNLLLIIYHVPLFISNYLHLPIFIPNYLVLTSNLSLFVSNLPLFT